MTITEETRRWVYRDDRILRAWATAMHDTVIVPLVSAWLDVCYHRGVLPLPPLGALRTEVWYRGDLT